MSLTPISLELRFLNIPTTWTRRRDLVSGEYALVPEVNDNRRAKPIEDAFNLRNEFLRMEHSEEAALKLLEKIGVWGLAESAPWSEAKGLSGDFGYRFIFKPQYPFPLTIEELWDEQERWKELLKNPAKLRAYFRPLPKDDDARPGDQYAFAFDTHILNTLPTHLESKPLPHAVIQPITGRELLIATAWVDLVSGLEIQVCEKCGIPFTSDRKRTFCPPTRYALTSPCAHAAAQRAYRIREAEKKKQQRENKPKKKSSR
jgi:hypothetical protein